MTGTGERSEYGARLFEARTHAKLTQPALAKAVGMAQSSLAELERRGQGSSKTMQLAAACGVSAEWLATGNGSMLGGSLDREVAELASAINLLPQKQRDWVLMTVRQAVELAQESLRVNADRVTRDTVPDSEASQPSSQRRRIA